MLPATTPLPAPAGQLVTADHCAAALGVNVRTFRRMVAAGEFPKPLKRNRRWARWYAQDLADFLAKLDKARQN